MTALTWSDVIFLTFSRFENKSIDYVSSGLVGVTHADVDLGLKQRSDDLLGVDFVKRDKKKATNLKTSL